jgi:hypothetical protein
LSTCDLVNFWIASGDILEKSGMLLIWNSNQNKLGQPTYKRTLKNRGFQLNFKEHRCRKLASLKINIYWILRVWTVNKIFTQFLSLSSVSSQTFHALFVSNRTLAAEAILLCEICGEAKQGICSNRLIELCSANHYANSPGCCNSNTCDMSPASQSVTT